MKCDFMENFLNFFINNIPNKIFLSDIAAVEAILIGIFIPVSINIVFGISQRYKSDIIVKKFLQSRLVIILPVFTIINIIIAVFFRFYDFNIANQMIWQVVAWVLFVFFFISMVILGCFFKLVRSYIYGSEYLIRKFFNEAEKEIK